MTFVKKCIKEQGEYKHLSTPDANVIGVDECLYLIDLKSELVHNL